jgi:hypothetical protein
MRSLLRYLPMLALLAAPLQVFGGTQASMQVSFTIVASCVVDAQGAKAPAVNCGQSVGYIVAPQAAQAAQAAPAAHTGIAAGSERAGWTVYF